MSADYPIAWSIAGSDSGGGAGIQADLHVFSAFGVHGCSITTAITAQNTCGIQKQLPLPDEIIQAQWQSVEEDLPARAIKSGMLAESVACIIPLIQSLDVPLICDPVMFSTSGDALFAADQRSLFIEELLPYTHLITPNYQEARLLLNTTSLSGEAMVDALLTKGAKAVLLTGGDESSPYCTDLFATADTRFRLESPRIDTRATHGTGCALSAAITAALALGQSLREALITAKTYLNQLLDQSIALGQGKGPMCFTPPCNEAHYRPNII